MKLLRIQKSLQFRVGKNKNGAQNEIARAGIFLFGVNAALAAILIWQVYILNFNKYFVAASSKLRRSAFEN